MNLRSPARSLLRLFMIPALAMGGILVTAPAKGAPPLKLEALTRIQPTNLGGHCGTQSCPVRFFSLGFSKKGLFGYLAIGEDHKIVFEVVDLITDKVVSHQDWTCFQNVFDGDEDPDEEEAAEDAEEEGLEEESNEDDEEEVAFGPEDYLEMNCYGLLDQWDWDYDEFKTDPGIFWSVHGESLRSKLDTLGIRPGPDQRLKKFPLKIHGDTFSVSIDTVTESVVEQDEVGYDSYEHKLLMNSALHGKKKLAAFGSVFEPATVEGYVQSPTGARLAVIALTFEHSDNFIYPEEDDPHAVKVMVSGAALKSGFKKRSAKGKGKGKK